MILASRSGRGVLTSDNRDDFLLDQHLFRSFNSVGCDPAACQSLNGSQLKFDRLHHRNNHSFICVIIRGFCSLHNVSKWVSIFSFFSDLWIKRKRVISSSTFLSFSSPEKIANEKTAHERCAVQADLFQMAVHPVQRFRIRTFAMRRLAEMIQTMVIAVKADDTGFNPLIH